MKQSAVEPQVLILHATILQSRHYYDAALAELDRALKSSRPRQCRPFRERPEFELARATIYRSLAATTKQCSRGSIWQRLPIPPSRTCASKVCADSQATCAVRTRRSRRLSTQGLPPQLRAWRYSEPVSGGEIGRR